MSRFALAVAILSFFAGLQGSGADVTLEDLQKKFMERKVKTLPCFYYGNSCELDRQFCDPHPDIHTCTDVFRKDASETDKIKKCSELLKSNETHLGEIDVCLYFLGTVYNQKVIQGGELTIEQLQKAFAERKPGELPCVHNAQPCQLSRQFCNNNTLSCEDVFPEGASKKQKIEICENLLKKNDSDPGPNDVCVYFLGSIAHQTGEPTKSNNTVIGLAVGLGVLILFVIIVVSVLYKIGYIKSPCQNQEQSVLPGAVNAPDGHNNDTNEDLDKRKKKQKQVAGQGNSIDGSPDGDDKPKPEELS